MYTFHMEKRTAENDMGTAPVPMRTVRRLPLYLKYLKSLPDYGPSNISATAMAKALNLNDVLVRKDLASVSSGGRPKTGYVIMNLISDIEQFLGGL
ncbi:MAG: winged-helix domain-containing protein [Oscillospiraceae bacterium]